MHTPFKTDPTGTCIARTRLTRTRTRTRRHRNSTELALPSHLQPPSQGACAYSPGGTGQRSPALRHTPRLSPHSTRYVARTKEGTACHAPLSIVEGSVVKFALETSQSATMVRPRLLSAHRTQLPALRSVRSGAARLSRSRESLSPAAARSPRSYVTGLRGTLRRPLGVSVDVHVLFVVEVYL